MSIYPVTHIVYPQVQISRVPFVVMFAKSSSSLRKKVKHIRKILGGDEEGPQPITFRLGGWRDNLPTADGTGDSNVVHRDPDEVAEITCPYDMPISHRDSGTSEPIILGTAGATSSNVRTGRPKARDSNEEIREGDVLRAGNAKGKDARARSPKDKDENVETEDSKSQSKGKEKESKSKKYNTGGRIKVRPYTRSNSFSDSSIDSSTGSIVDANTVFRKWPDEELALQREVIEKYEAGKKLWTKESLLEMERKIADANPVHLDAYAGAGQDFEKQEGSETSPVLYFFLILLR